MVKITLIKSPDEWAITKQACRDELVLYLSFSSHNIYIALLLCIEHCFTKVKILHYIYRKSASRFSRVTVLNTLKQSRINIMRGKKDATTFPDKPVSWIASLFRGLMKEYSCDYRVYTRKIYIIRGKLKNFKVQLLRSNALFLCRHEDTSSLRLFSDERSGR